MVTDNFSKSGLDLNGKVDLSLVTALDWGADGRLYVTEQDGGVKALSIAFGSPSGEGTNSFYVTDAEVLDQIQSIPNYNDDGSLADDDGERQVTGISVVPRYDDDGKPVMLDGKAAVSVYVTSSDNRIGAGRDGEDSGLDTNSSMITRLDQTASGWETTDIVRGLARSEENHSINGLEVVQELDDQGHLVSERLIVANGGNTNSGAPSNNFAGQQETAYSGAILEVDLDQLKGMEVKTDDASGRQYIYDVPTLDDPTWPGEDPSDPFGGHDALNAGKIDPDGPVQIYSAGYRNAYDVEVTDDGRVWTYDNGANNSWGGRPIGEAGDDDGNVDYAQDENYIATNLNNGDVNTGDTINLDRWSPKNYDQFHEVTRSDDLAGRLLSAGQGGAATYEWQDPDSGETLTLVYGGHPNPTRASGGQSGLLFTPDEGVTNAFLLMSNVDKEGDDSSDYAAAIDYYRQVETENDSVATGDLSSRVIGVTPGERYYITEAGKAYLVDDYEDRPDTIDGASVVGVGGMPADFDEVVATINPIEGNYLEAGYTDGALDSGKGSINGLTEYTSTILDDPDSGIKMSGSLFASSLNQGSLIIMGRDDEGVMHSTVGSDGQSLAEERATVGLSGGPLGLASIGDDLSAFGFQKAFQGSVWSAVFKQNGPAIEILQPDNGKVPLAGSDVVIDPTDRDGDGIDHIHDPFEFSADNGLDLGAGESIVLDFQPTESPFPGTVQNTGLMGAALDGMTPNRDAKTEAENFAENQQRDGLYDLGGNIIPGGNAPIYQIKKVAGGTVMGSDNSARDAMHVGIKPGDDVGTLEMSSSIKNWIPSVDGGIKPGQQTGIMLGDGTQSNFLRLVFGAVLVDGELVPGFEVGYELDDNYTTLARVATPELNDVSTLDLELAVDTANGFAVKAGYRLDGNAEATSIDLDGFSLPPGVLQDVLTGEHRISDGDVSASSGAAVGFIAETSPFDAESDNGLSAIDFYDLKINASGLPDNVIEAGNAEEVSATGTAAEDTLVYTGTDTQLGRLDDSIEHFDGSGSTADFSVQGNAQDNVLVMGSGHNTISGGDGADSIRGTFANIDGTTLEDFSPQDELLVTDSRLSAADVSYRQENGVLKLVLTDPESGQTATVDLAGSGVADVDPADAPKAFSIEQTEQGTRISYSLEQVLYRVNAGGETIAASDGGPDWLGDTGADFAYLKGNTDDIYRDKATDEAQEIDLSQLEGDIPWQLFADERGDHSTAMPKLEYGFPITPGETYSVTLYYTENWSGIFKEEGGRSFDVEVAGQVPDAFKGIDPLAEAREILGPDATQEDLLGLGLSRTYTFTAEDEMLDLAFNHGVENPKINAIEIKQLGGGVAPQPAIPPQVDSIVVEEATDSDSPLQVTVTVSDDTGIDTASIDGDELVFSGIEPASVALAERDAIVLGDDGKSATITYVMTPPQDGNAWPEGSYGVSIAQGSYQDSDGNGVQSFEAHFDIAQGGVDTGGSSEEPAPSTAEEVIAGLDLDTPDSYADDAVGSAEITVTPDHDVQYSNYGSNAFQVTNTGDKKIAAVYFDVSDALYDDSVFDADGKGGDTVAKPWQIDDAGASGAIDPAQYEHYFQPGADPDSSDASVNGGYKGALIKFSATQDGGFSRGETVGFSGDMDPNSIAGMEKSDVDTDSLPDWDVGGVSGAELIGSTVHVVFTDGSVATSQLMADGSQSGAQARVVEQAQELEAGLSVNGLSPGMQGSYDEAPSVEVSGPANEWVRVVMTKGHQPVTADGLADIVEGRLEDNAFPANNAAEFQFADVKLDASGTADVSDQFVYEVFQNGTEAFAGDDALPLGFVASVIEDPNSTEAFALGGVSEPIYLFE